MSDRIEVDQSTGEVVEIQETPLSAEDVEKRVEAILESIRDLERELNVSLGELGKWVPAVPQTSPQFQTVMDTISYYQQVESLLAQYFTPSS